MDIQFFSSFHSCLYEITIWMCSEEIAVRLHTLKMASMDAETLRSENYCVIYHTQYSALKVGFDKLCYTTLYSSQNVRDQVQHPHKTTGKIVDLYILIFAFLESNLTDKIFFTEWYQAFSEFNVLLKFSWMQFRFIRGFPKYLLTKITNAMPRGTKISRGYSSRLTPLSCCIVGKSPLGIIAS